MIRPTPLREVAAAHNPLIPQLGQLVQVPTPSGTRYARVHRATDASCTLTFLLPEEQAVLAEIVAIRTSRWRRAKLRARGFLANLVPRS